MATLSLTFGSFTASKTISAGDLTRLLDAYKKNYGQIPDGAGGMRDMTNQELFDTFAAGFFSGIVNAVKSVESETACAAARAGVTSIILS